MLFLAAMFAAGIAVFSIVQTSLSILTPICALFAIGAFAFRKRGYATLLISAAYVIAGGVVYQAYQSSITTDRIRSIYDSGQFVSGEPVEITGTLTRYPEAAVDGVFVHVDVESIWYRDESRAASGSVRLFAPINTPEMADDYRRLDLDAGARVRVVCDLNRDDGFRNPGVLSKKTILDWQDIDATGTIKSPLLVEKLGIGRAGSTGYVFGTRERLIAKFRELFSPQVAGVMIASLLGNKHFLDKETAEVFREGGTFHILVISGLHITFIGGLAALIVGIFTRRKVVQFVVVCSFLWLYTIAVGGEVPVVRASLMFTVLWFSFVIHRTGSLANTLGTCGLILLAWRPADLFTPSFQLTFVSVAAIVLAAFPLVRTIRSIGEWTPTSSEPFPARVPKWLRRSCETLYWNPKRWDTDSARNVWSANLFKAPFYSLNRTVQKVLAYAVEGIIVSLLVQVAMLPLLVHYFHRVTPGSVLMNLWAGLFIALESFVSLFAILFSFLSGSLALPFVLLTEFLHWFLVSVPGYLTGVQWLSFRVPVYTGHEIWLYIFYFLFAMVLALFLFRWDPFSLPSGNNKSRLERKVILSALSGLLLLTCVIAFHPFSEPWPDGRLHVQFLDVGQGDSIFITFPNGKTMLVDAGGRPSYRDEDEIPFEPDLPSIGEAVVSEFLWEKGYSRIDAIVATHADADHILGLSDIARNFRLGEAWFGSTNSDDPDVRRLTDILDRNEVPKRSLERGDRLEIGGVLVEILSPPTQGAETRTENDRSIVIRLTFGSRSLLLTGDIEKLAESEIADSRQNLLSDVVKVPHHGSKSSSTEPLVASTHPTFAIIPVGRRSIFGHPHKETVERWRAIGAKVMTTGEEGTISFSTNGADLVLSTFVPK